MARSNKKTRIKGLPSKILIQERDALTGSFPSKVRIPSDNRTGNYKVNFNDTNTINFNKQNLNLGATVPTHLLDSKQYQKFGVDISSSLEASGTVQAGVSDEFVSFTPGQSLTPYKDNNNPAVDGLSARNPFYATGSRVADVGIGFDQPVWSKSKIEIDVPVVSETTLSVTSGSPQEGSSFPMAYYNAKDKTWEGIGLGLPFGVGFNTSADTDEQNFLEKAMVGFAPSLAPPVAGAGRDFATGELTAAGFCVGDLGFPSHAKFHATSSQVLKMSQYISEPFVVEKIVMETSASFEVGSIELDLGVSAEARVSGAINTFFILNQRPYTTKKFVDNDIRYLQIMLFADVELAYTSSTRQLSPSSLLNDAPFVEASSSRDLVTFFNISSYASGAREHTGSVNTPFGATTSKFFDRDLVLVSDSDSSISGVNWTKRLTAETSARLAPQGNRNIFSCQFDAHGDDIILSNRFGGRNNLGVNLLSGKNLLGNFVGVNSTIKTSTVSAISPIAKINPYILHPNDELILGWQQPLLDKPRTRIVSPHTSSQITFHPGDFKLVLYGSQIRNGEEQHDTLNQLLTSDTAHEVIE